MNRLKQQQTDLVGIEQEITDKANLDIKHYGVPLKNKRLRDKLAAKERAIEKTIKSLSSVERKLEKKFALTKRDSKVLSALRNGDSISNTTTAISGSSYDNRFNGSAASRNQARTLWRRTE